ncbi:tetratricopeptide repeat protein [Novosphingobium flavum]|uniref:protein O-GlcNAc transferase n=1 Tax=Novosphingobium flavum TaxID=1778672 RepID=A0A7X1KMX4_9SPHN|nr:tetratricopeptide repeat protein [Novosphingobium flavum]MBC2666823.1 tetratricopeptide repeat protein [Novosphingobium flavum]
MTAPFPAVPLDVGQILAQGFTAHQQGNLAEAEARYAAILRLVPDHFDALHLSGVIAQAGGDNARAEQLIRRALKLNPTYADAWSNLGQALAGASRPLEAIKAYDRALALNPASIPARFNRGSALVDVERHAEALADFDRVIELAPTYAEAHNFRSVALCGVELFAEAIAATNRALELKPDFTEPLINRAAALRMMNRHGAAVADLTRAFAADPGFVYPRSLLATSRVAICDWTDVPQAMAMIRAERAAGGKLQGGNAWDVLALSDDPADVLMITRDTARRLVEHAGLARGAKTQPPRPRRRADGRIRIGYVSSDFGEHPVAHLINHALELHDRSRFEVHGISLMHRPGAQAERIRQACDHFHEIVALNDDQAARMIRDLGIDVAVCLNGYTAGERSGIFARRPAPVQVNFLGFAATMGADFIDYIVVDPVLAPPGADRHYSEKVVRLPQSYQPSDTTRTLSDRAMTRAEWGLPETGFVFCSFNNNFKIMPDVFAAWMRLLQQVEGSVLWLRKGQAEAMDNLKAAAAAQGVDPGRLVFAGFADLADHNARHRLADLFLDTFPYGAHTTANDALWAGLPVLTRAGQCYHSRVAASLLHAIGLPELVTASVEEYEAMALTLARDPARLADLTARLRANRDTTPLFDMPRWVADIEKAYSEMVRGSDARQKPAAIDVAAL